MTVDERALIEKATTFARDQGWDVDAYRVDAVEVGTDRTWISFRGVDPAPGNHFSVWIDNESSDVIQLVPGR